MKHPVLLFTSLSNKHALYCAVNRQAKQFNPASIVMGADSNLECPASSKVDFFVQTPETEIWKEADLVSFCEKYKITHIIPTRDGELKFWSDHAAKLSSLGVSTMISNQQGLSYCLDKYSCHQLLSTSSPLQPIATALNPEDLKSNRFVVKERYGSGATSIGINLGLAEAKNWAQKIENPVFQPYIEGRELSAETWVDRLGKCHGMLLRWRTKVVKGEAFQSEVFQDPVLERDLIQCVENIPGIRGHCLTQVKINTEGVPQIIEMNPRLGGASPLALHAGLNSILWFLEESHGLAEKIPNSPATRYGSKLLNENGMVQIIDPFPSRQTKSEE